MKNKNEIMLLVEFFQVKDKNKMICKSQECKLSIVQDNLEKNQYSILCKNEDYQEEDKNEKNWMEMKFPITKNLYICQFCNLFIQYFLWKFKGIIYIAKILIDEINKNTNIFKDNNNMNNYSNNKINESNIFINNNIDSNHKKYNNKKNELNYKTPNYDPIKITQSLRENSNNSSFEEYYDNQDFKII